MSPQEFLLLRAKKLKNVELVKALEASLAAKKVSAAKSLSKEPCAPCQKKAKK